MSSNPWRGYLASFGGHMKREKVGGQYLLKVEVDPLGLQRILVNTFTAAPQEAASPKVEKELRAKNLVYISHQ